MEACIYRKFGPPSVLEIVKDVPVPPRGAGQILVKVQATGVNPVDLATRLGSIPLAKNNKVRVIHDNSSLRHKSAPVAVKKKRTRYVQ